MHTLKVPLIVHIIFLLAEKLDGKIKDEFATHGSLLGIDPNKPL